MIHTFMIHSIMDKTSACTYELLHYILIVIGIVPPTNTSTETDFFFRLFTYLYYNLNIKNWSVWHRGERYVRVPGFDVNQIQRITCFISFSSAAKRNLTKLKRKKMIKKQSCKPMRVAVDAICEQVPIIKRLVRLYTV